MAIVRKDITQASYHGGLESVKVFDKAGTNKVQVTNGVFVHLQGLLEGRELRKAVLGDKATATQEVLFIHNPEVMYDERKYKLKDYVIPADKVARAYRLYRGDILTLTTDLFVGTVAVGDKLVVHTNGLLGKDSTALTTARVVFEVIENSGYELDPEMGAFAVQVISI